MAPLDRELCATLGELVILRQGTEKQAMFQAAGRGADLATKALWNVGKPAAKFVGRGAAKLPRKAWNLAMEAGGVRGLTKEQKLLKLLSARGLGKDWDVVKSLAAARGVKNPVTAGRLFFSPMSTLSPRFSESGQARWLLGKLADPKFKAQFLHGAGPAEAAAVKNLSRYFPSAEAAGSTSLAGNLAPFGVFGGIAGYQALTGADSDAMRPIVTSPHRGFAMQGKKDPNAIERFWNRAGEGIGQLSPGLGSALAEHPYLSTAGAATATAGGLYGLRSLLRQKDDSRA